MVFVKFLLVCLFAVFHSSQVLVCFIIVSICLNVSFQFRNKSGRRRTHMHTIPCLEDTVDTVLLSEPGFWFLLTDRQNKLTKNEHFVLTSVLPFSICVLLCCMLFKQYRFTRKTNNNVEKGYFVVLLFFELAKPKQQMKLQFYSRVLFIIKIV